MTKQPKPVDPDPRTNYLLARLDPADYQSLISAGRVVALKLGQRLYRDHEPVDAVYFPLTCMFCIVVSTSKKKPRLELVTVGKEGVVGATEVFHSKVALGIHVVQIPGLAICIPGNSFHAVLNSRPAIEKLFHLHLYALTRQILQGALCNHLHKVEKRCIRWLLITHDSAGQDTFPLTQEFLSHMLGVRRATVNEAIGILKRSGYVSFVRGKLTILDRRSLEESSCECYEAGKEIYKSAMNKR